MGFNETDRVLTFIGQLARKIDLMNLIKHKTIVGLQPTMEENNEFRNKTRSAVHCGMKKMPAFMPQKYARLTSHFLKEFLKMGLQNAELGFLLTEEEGTSKVV